MYAKVFQENYYLNRYDIQQTWAYQEHVIQINEFSEEKIFKVFRFRTEEIGKVS